NAFQDCNDPAAWPFAAVARSAAAKRPDLVVHIGDMHYRESPCPADRSGCSGSAWGYGDDAWQADFFRPAAPLLAAAPWLFVRGNHESCGRAGLGWFRFFDARRWQPQNSCVDPQNDSVADFTAPFAVPLTADTQLLVFDTASVSSRP
ncbi:metallophosphoesterase, partial [Roseateles sp. GG27B]